MGKGIGGHTKQGRGASVEWQTPPEILAALGPFDDDPALPGRADGLTREWNGLVWLNAPYPPWEWLKRLARHRDGGVAIIFARTETRGFKEHVWRSADALFFLYGRPRFYCNGVPGKWTSGGPVVLVAYGSAAKTRLARVNLPGVFVSGWEADG